MGNRTGGNGFAIVAARHAMTSSEAGSENHGALPSSYRRRIRKSRSLATVNQASNFRLRIQRSVPFLRRQSTTTFHKSSDAAWERHDEAVQLARAHYLSGSDHHETQDEEQSRFQRSDVREHRKFRKSVRASLITDVNSPPPVKRSSSLTATIRNRVRKVIGRTLTKKDSLPPQQLEAQRNHFSAFERDGGPASCFDAYQVADGEMDAYPTVPEYELLEDLDKFPYTVTSSASRESLHSNARSRVTSWANSSITDSIGLRSGAIERNRLSIIKEDGGPHQPSSSAGRHIGGVEQFSEPFQDFTNNIVPAIDSQRIYSALMKRINEEDAGVERPTLAGKSKNQALDESSKAPYGTKLTIRAVHSESSLATLTTDRQSRQFSSQSGSSGLDGVVSGTIVDVRHKENAGRQRDRLVEQEQSSFFPFSSEKSPNTPSPFKRFLTERRSRTQTRSRSRSSSRGRNHVQDADGGSVIVNRKSSNPIMARPRFGLSSASIYSRTTNGGTNEHYQRPIQSSEELRVTGLSSSDCAGMAADGSGTTASYDHSQWNPWSETLDERHREASRNPHVRERAQISSEEDSLDSGKVPSRAVRGGQSQVDLIATPVAMPLEVRPVASSGQAHSQPREISSADVLSTISNKAEDGSKGGGSLRKLSPGNLVKLFKERKSQKQSTPQSTGKENSPVGHEGSPPISTPGRLHLQFRDGTSTGRLRKRASETVVHARDGVYSTPHNSISTSPSRSHESPSENAKNHLVARLSRPFNMDVPPHNRPFDSMYLGKRTFGHPDTFGNNRLSVAPRISEDMSHSNRGSAEGQTTALPSSSHSAGGSAVKIFGLLGSKRMVSNFLKSRRGDKDMSSGGNTVTEGSPAFI